MSGRIGNAAQLALLQLVYENQAMANVGNTAGLQPSGVAGSLWVALHTSDPGAAGNQQSSEAAYPGYGRTAVTRAGGSWTTSGSSPTSIANAALVSMPVCTSGGPETEAWFSVGTLQTGAGEILWAGPLSASLIVNAGETPTFAIGALVCTLD